MIKKLTVDSNDFRFYSKWMKERGFLSASYYSMHGYDSKKLRKQAMEGNINAIKCYIGKTVKWYYAERQAELAYLKGDVCY